MQSVQISYGDQYQIEASGAVGGAVTLASGVSVEVVEVGITGPEGPKGDRGEQGPSGDLSHEHTQSLAAAVWTINHNLGKHPSVTVVDSAGDECEGVINYPSTSQVVITFSAAFSGRAFLN